jgi:D-arabinose 1-dehydrogenase-like Zn-dependent alcohol dehydrogenase
MQAVVLRDFGSSENLVTEEVATPVPGPGEVLLRVRACGVCYHDVIHRRGGGRRPAVAVSPMILGHEVAGEVVDVGPGVTGWAYGHRAATLQRLCCGECKECLTGRPSLCRRDRRSFGEELPGGYAEYMVAPVGGLGRVPLGLSWATAAATCCTTGTAVHCVRTRARVQPGETVLVTGASGGVGLQAIQVAVLDGARVIAVSSSADKESCLLEAGASCVVIAPDLDFAAPVAEFTRGEGVDVALEIVGSRTFGQTLRCLAPGGRLVVIGNLDAGAGQSSVAIDPSLVIVDELEILGAYATTRAELEEAMALVATGRVQPFVCEELPLAQAARAHQRLEDRQVSGRMVLCPTAPRLH